MSVCIIHFFAWHHSFPCLWYTRFMDKKGYIDTDGFKFHDYFSSVDIPFYDGIENFDSYLKEDTWKSLFTEYEKYILPYKIYVIYKKNYYL